MQVSLIERFKDATIGFSGYPRLARDKATGFGYLALLLLIVLAISAAIDTFTVKRAISATVVSQLQAAPDFALANGEFRFDGPMPFIIHDADRQIIIDTTGKTTLADIERSGRGSLLLTRTSLIQKNATGQVQETDLTKIPITVTKENVIGLLSRIHWMVPIGYLFIYPFQLGFKAVDAVILGAIGLVVASGMNRKVTFDLTFKLGLYAVTLPTVLQWLFPGFHTLSRYGFLIWWGLAIVYMVMGVRTYLQEAGGEPPTA